jgi:hypothetical protein
MDGIEEYLGESVFYPASGLDGAPVKFLGKNGFRRFFYADYAISREKFARENRERGFCGYRWHSTDELDFEAVFGCDWDTILHKHRCLITTLQFFDWDPPFVAVARFERLASYADDHGPVHFELIFARCEAVTTYTDVFSRRRIAPKCIAYIRSGIGYGGNYPDFPQRLEEVLRQNPGGLPEFMLYDHLAADRRMGDYLSLIQEYEPIQRWDYRTEGYGVGSVTWAKLRARGTS